jgi:hypothetical protein
MPSAAAFWIARWLASGMCPWLFSSVPSMSIAMSLMTPPHDAEDLGAVTDLIMQKSQIVVAHLIERLSTVTAVH